LLQNFAAVMSVSEDLLCSFELLKVRLALLMGGKRTMANQRLCVRTTASGWSRIEEGDGEEQAEKVSTARYWYWYIKSQTGSAY